LRARPDRPCRSDGGETTAARRPGAAERLTDRVGTKTASQHALVPARPAAVQARLGQAGLLGLALDGQLVTLTATNGRAPPAI